MVSPATTEDTSITTKFGEVLRGELSGVDLNNYDDRNWENLIMKLHDKGINVTVSDEFYRKDQSETPG